MDSKREMRNAMNERLLVLLTLGFLAAVVFGCSDANTANDAGDAMMRLDVSDEDAGGEIDQGVEVDATLRLMRKSVIVPDVSYAMEQVIVWSPAASRTTTAWEAESVRCSMYGRMPR